MKKIIFIIAVIIAMSFFMILGFEAKTMQKKRVEENQKEMEVIAEDVEDISEIEIEQKQQENTEKTTTETESVISQKETQKSEVSNSQQQEQNSNKTTSVKENVRKQEPKKEQEDFFKNVEENVEIKQEELENKPQEEILVEEEKQDDEEYERLMKVVEYATYDECMKAGFEIAFSDTVNILGFDPIEIIYKGKVIGYKLKINYTNPMEN